MADDTLSTPVKKEKKDGILYVNGGEDYVSNESNANVATKGSAEIMVGGDIKRPPAYAILAGFDDGPHNSEIQVPIHSLPTTLGRTHQPCKINQFVPLGSCKALSRNQAMIFYCDETGGNIENKLQAEARNDCIAIDAEFNYRRSSCKNVINSYGKRKDTTTASTDLSSRCSGFAIECLGKNKIFVGKQRVEQGEIARLENGTPIKMASYCLYFVLPKGQRSTRSVSVTDNDGNSPPVKKQKRQYNRKTPLIQMEDRPLDELLREFHHAIESDVFDRKHQMVSSGIMMHAVKTVAKDSEMINQSKTEGGLSRADIMDFIEKYAIYSKWVKRIMTKMELKTYQANLSKALVKAGYKRVGTTGRHVKWLIPGIDYEINAASKQDLKLTDTVTSNQAQIRCKERASESSVNNNTTDLKPTGSFNERSESKSMNFVTNPAATNPTENLESISTKSTISEIPLFEKTASSKEVAESCPYLHETADNIRRESDHSTIDPPETSNVVGTSEIVKIGLIADYKYATEDEQSKMDIDIP